MIAQRNSMLLFATAVLLIGGCDLSETTGNNQLEAGLFEARVTGDVNGSYRGRPYSRLLMTPAEMSSLFCCSSQMPTLMNPQL